MNGAQPSIAVVICSHRIERWEWLCNSIASVQKQTLAVNQIVVVVDGDPLLAIRAREALAEECKVVIRPTRGGLSAARNSGLSEVHSEYVAFLDDDAEADTEWMAMLMDAMSDPKVLGSGGRSIPIWDSGDRPAWFPEELLWIVGCSYRGLPLGPSIVRNVFGGCAVYRTELFARFGGFLEEFGRKDQGAAGCEETEFCIRVAARLPEGSFRYEPSAIIRHHVPLQRERLSYVIQRSFAEGMSKALLVQHFGDSTISRKLGTEIYFLRSTVIKGVWAGIVRGLQGDLASIAGIGVLVASLGSALCGYGYQMLRRGS